MDASAPGSIESHSEDYKTDAWKEYSMRELGNFVHLLTKRATHRDNPEKEKQDLYDARNYLRMMEAKLDALEEASSVED